MPSLTWSVVRANTSSVWDSVTLACPSATFFQTRPWAEVLATTFPAWKADPVVEFSDGNLMVLPILKHTITGYREGMIPHVYGGPIFSRLPNEEHLLAAQQIATWFPDITLVDNPFCPYSREQDGLARWRLETTATDLACGFETLWKRLRDTNRRHFRSAQKQGVGASIARSIQEVDEYFNIYQQSLRRWGEGANGFYPRRLFRNLFAMTGFGGDAKLWIARKDGLLIGGIIMLYHGKQAVYWHGVSDVAHSSLHPSPFLLITAMQDACANGFRWFDFMGPNQHLKGVQHFKDGFASQRVPYNAYYARNSVKGLLFTRYRRFKEHKLRLCPM